MPSKIYIRRDNVIIVPFLHKKLIQSLISEILNYHKISLFLAVLLFHNLADMEYHLFSLNSTFPGTSIPLNR